VKLVPGVNIEKTPTLNQAGITYANLCRWRDGLIEKIGGWVRFFPFQLGTIPRALLAWQDIQNVDHLAVGADGGLFVITNGNSSAITPQTTTTNTPPFFTATASSKVIQIVDSNVSGLTVNDSVFVAVPVSVGGQVLQGLYAISSVLSTNTYQIQAAQSSTLSTTSHTVTIAAGVVTWASHSLLANAPVFFSTTGTLTNLTAFQVYYVVGSSIAANTFEVSVTPGGAAIVSSSSTPTTTATANAGTVPFFTTTSGSATVNVLEPSHGLSVGEQTPVFVPVTVGGVTLSGAYLAQTVTDANNFTIAASTTASSTAGALENSGNVQLIYYVAIGPQPAAQPYGSGVYGGGAYGVGVAPSGGSGTPITATDWTLDNWGEILVACPTGSSIYIWEPNTGFSNARLVPNAPIINTGMFLAMPLQIMVAFGSSFSGVPNPLGINWTTSGDFTVWTPLSTNQAGGYQIPTGSKIVGAMQGPQQGLVWTDIDLYSMQYVGFPNVFGFSKIMTGCGLIGLHGAGLLGNTVYWMSQEQFFMQPAGGAPQAMPCTVWDYIFQNLDTANAHKVRCAPNSRFGTIAWHFPSLSGGTGENDSFVEYNAIEGEWTFGQYPTTGRSAWIDQSVLGPPIGAGPNQVIYQHEVGYNADGSAMNPIFTTGYWSIGEGEDFYFVDQFIPDFKYGLQGGSQAANMLVTIFVVNYPNDTPTVKGPYPMSTAIQYISTRLRGRQLAITVQSADLNSWWRIGECRYRAAPAGRR
jgi:hypothetical protein